jgi:isopentenyl diphosphate isomerase/L-lactate dehydrogenase-like FMN-dependent dehydrogenase
LWRLAAGGQTGVETALGLLRQELDLAMALAGCADLKTITPDLVLRGVIAASSEI